MPSWLIDLLGWTALFAVLFFFFRSRQNRKNEKGDD